MDKAEDNGVVIVKNDEENCVMLYVDDTMYPDTVKVTQLPYGWKDTVCKYNKGDLLFKNLDNHGGWSSNALHPSFKYDHVRYDGH